MHCLVPYANTHKYISATKLYLHFAPGCPSHSYVYTHIPAEQQHIIHILFIHAWRCRSADPRPHTHPHTPTHAHTHSRTHTHTRASVTRNQHHPCVFYLCEHLRSLANNGGVYARETTHLHSRVVVESRCIMGRTMLSWPRNDVVPKDAYTTR